MFSRHTTLFTEEVISINVSNILNFDEITGVNLTGKIKQNKPIFSC